MRLDTSLFGLLIANQLQTILAQDQQKFLLIKLVLFIDMTLSNHLRNNLRVVDTDKLQEFMSAYIKQVESNFSGLKSDTFGGVRLKLVETRMYKPGVPSNGDIDQLLGEFCSYQSEEKLNRPIDGDWQLSLLLTSLNLFSSEDTRDYGSLEKSQSTMGVSVIDGINWQGLGCLIVEFGTNYNEPLETQNSTEKIELKPISYMNPSRGFASTWVAAHEIGHSLGMHHDGPPFNPECNDGGVMSHDSDLNLINLTWSKCSLDRVDNFVNSSFLISEQRTIPIDIEQLPGQIFDLRSQCETFAANLQAHFKPSDESICRKTAWCQLKSNISRHLDDSKFVAIGPALDGSVCDEAGSKICFQRQCVKMTQVSLVDE